MQKQMIEDLAEQAEKTCDAAAVVVQNLCTQAQLQVDTSPHTKTGFEVLRAEPDYWLEDARRHFQKGLMSLRRAVHVDDKF